MNIVIVIKKGEYYNYTLASVKFNKHGQNLPLAIVTCNEWIDIIPVIKKKYDYALFVDSGTVFYDIEDFIDRLFKYPNAGLIGHLTDPLNDRIYYYLHEQCFFLKLDLFNSDDFVISDATRIVPERSVNNIHHTYTPLWIKASDKKQNYKG